MSDKPLNPFDDAEEIAKKSMVLFFLIDCSGSMGGSKIGTVNSVMEELIPEIRGIGGADADIKIAVLKFSGGSEWMYSEPISVEDFEWKPLDAENVTDLGSAFTELSSKLSRNSFMNSPSLSFAPVMILMSVRGALNFQADKNSAFPLPGYSLKIRLYLFLMRRLRHWIMKVNMLFRNPLKSWQKTGQLSSSHTACQRLKMQSVLLF